MTTLENIREKLESLIASGKSGIVALCGDPYPAWPDEPFWEYHDALVFIGPLETVMATVDNCISFFRVPTKGDSFLADFAEREDSFAVTELGFSEEEYLDICTAVLLDDLAHDDLESGNFDLEDFDAGFVYPSEEDAFCPDTQFTLTGAEDVAGDIRNFRALLESGGEFVFRQPDGSEKKFSVSCCKYYDEEEEAESDVYALSTMATESFIDEDTGAETEAECRVRLLRSCNWRTFYAKSRLFIFLNYGSSFGNK